MLINEFHHNIKDIEMENCYSCGVPFDETNNSLEHIINNSIGGRWRSKWLLCKKCNEDFGGGIDRSLDKQLGILTDHLGVFRQREKDNIALPMKGPDGSVKMVSKQLKPLARLTTRFPDREDVVEYFPEEEIERRMDEKRAQLLNKYKTVREIQYTELPTNEVYKLQNSGSMGNVDFELGGDESFRSITKMAINYYLFKKYDLEWVKHAISMIKAEINNEIAFFFYPDPNHYLVHDLSENEVSHIIHIRGNTEKKLLYAYVELFNMQNVLIRLNMDYGGPDINETYAFDLMSGKKVHKDIVIKLTKPHFEILHLITKANRQQINLRYRRLELIIEKNQMGRK